MLFFQPFCSTHVEASLSGIEDVAHRVHEAEGSLCCLHGSRAFFEAAYQADGCLTVLESGCMSWLGTGSPHADPRHGGRHDDRASMQRSYPGPLRDFSV